MKIFYSIFFFVIGYCYASPEEKLFVSVKGENICLFTKGNYKNIFDNQILFYMGEVIPNEKFKSSYSKTYVNLKNMPIQERDCILVDVKNFKSKVPYYLYLESDRSYSQRVCMDRKQNKIVLTEVKNVFNCGKEEYDYSGKSWWRIFLSWFGFD